MTLSESSRRNWTWHRLCQPAFPLLALVLVFSFLSSVHANFIINEPSMSASWANGSPYPFSWTKGLLDGIDAFDVELTRLHGNGLILVAQNVPATYKSLNILLQDVPEGDDYFIICLNSTHGIVHAVSDRFIITNSSSKNPSPNPKVPTVTVSGGPDPLKQFATTLGPSASSALRLSPDMGVFGFGGMLALCAAFLGSVMTLW